MSIPNLPKLAYKTLQQGKNIAGLAHKGLSTKLMEVISPGAIPPTSPVSRRLLLELKESMDELEKVDWMEAEQGIYPKIQLFEAPWIKWASRYPMIWLDLPSTWARRKNRRVQDIPKKIDKDLYPDYYLQNFHHQTDGYLSDHSAELYDLQVEILFNGTADSMRRRVLAPLRKGLDKFNLNKSGNLKILDIATGTGRTLRQIQSAFPDAELLGLDLSASYLREASQSLNKREKRLAQLIRGNAENLPFKDNSFHGITCVFLLHELPKNARQNVINECWRVIEPGGVIVIADSIQIADSPSFTPIMENFHRVFHEPYYRDYISDNINARLETAGFNEISAKSHFMTRVWTGKKPI